MDDHAELKERMDEALEILGFGDLPYDEIRRTDIKRAYKAKMLVNHPDRRGGDDEELIEIAKRLSTAYEFIDGLMLHDDDLSFMMESIDDRDDAYTAEKLLELVRTLVRHGETSWMVTSCLDMPRIPKGVCIKQKRSCAYTYPSKIRGGKVKRVSSLSKDFLDLLFIFSTVLPENVYHLRVPRRVSKPSKRTQIWIIWRAKGTYNSVSMYACD